MLHLKQDISPLGFIQHISSLFDATWLILFTTFLHAHYFIQKHIMYVQIYNKHVTCKQSTLILPFGKAECTSWFSSWWRDPEENLRRAHAISGRSLICCLWLLSHKHSGLFVPNLSPVSKWNAMYKLPFLRRLHCVGSTYSIKNIINEFQKNMSQ